MTVRFFVTSASLVIFSWLAATFLRAVPMDSYPRPPALTAEQTPGGSSEVSVLADRPEKFPVRFISTATATQ